MTSRWFISIFEISVLTSPVILILVILSPYLNKHYTIKWKYPAWTFIAIWLIIPFHMDIPKKFTVNIPVQVTTNIIENGGVKSLTSLNTKTGSREVLARLSTKAGSMGVTLLGIISVIWFAGFIAILFINLFSGFYFKKQALRKGTYIKDGYILEQLQLLLYELKIKRHIPVIQYPGIKSPLVTGLFCPFLILPAYKYSKEELYFILKHELLHIKHHDIFFKFIFLTANAVHWFNPVIYIMRKETSVDIELFCDEMVVAGMDFNNKKAYTKILFSLLKKQNKENRAKTFSTQLYGGVNIMKKRFRNILTKSKRKNGSFLLAFTIILAAVPGIFTGCQVTGREFMAEVAERAEIDNNIIIKKQENEKQESATGTNVELKQIKKNKKEISLSEDSIKIKKIVEKFSNAYFNKNKKNIKKFLEPSYGKDIEVYNIPGKASNFTLKGLGNIKNQKSCTVSLEFKASKESDTFMYLTVGLIKYSGNWKINFYGLEL